MDIPCLAEMLCRECASNGQYLVERTEKACGGRSDCPEQPEDTMMTGADAEPIWPVLEDEMLNE
jgi:hypothetical protein